jgi:hypothetical protein
MKKVLVIATAAALAAAAVHAELPEEPSKTTGWLYAGLGFGSHEFAASAAVNVKYIRFLGTLRATFMGTISGGFFGPGEEVYDVGLLFGYCPLKSFSIAAGVAMVRGERYYGGDLLGGGRPSEYIDAVGVPIEVQFTPVKGRAVGLGIVGYVNINSEESFGGVTVGIELGKLK